MIIQLLTPLFPFLCKYGFHANYTYPSISPPFSGLSMQRKMIILQERSRFAGAEPVPFFGKIMGANSSFALSNMYFLCT